MEPQRHKPAQTQAQWQDEIARRILGTVRSGLYLDLRYLNAALCALVWKPQENHGPFATDGVTLYYSADWLVGLYRKNRRYLCRAYLHSVLHCVFRHLWLRDNREPHLWNLSCDIATEYVLDHLNIPTLARPVGLLRQQTYARLQAGCGILAAGPIYRALCKQYADADADTDTAEKLQALCREFYCDSHRHWPADQNAPAAQIAGQNWEQLGRQTQLSMEQDGRMAGQSDGSNALAMQTQAGRSRRSYKDFLRRFATLREEPLLSPDEFDLGYYSYGLRVYGNMPLLEPLETHEVHRIRDFAIVLDTSDSTSGTLIKAFLKETFSLLQTAGSFASRCRICILQADDAVRHEEFISSADELDRYMRRFTLHGGGGTDFRPAFARIVALQAEGAFDALRGILYFTDGKGQYPTQPPSCETAFLFVQNEATPPPGVPPWAMKLILEPEELLPSATPTLPKGWDALNQDENETEELDSLPQT